MKKLFALLAVALGVVACQKDQADFGVNLGGEQEVTINVALSAETRASSALGSLDNDVLKAHDLRYTLEIYQGDHCLRMEKFTTEDNVAFPVRLAPGREYKFAVWADFVKKEGEDAHKDLYYSTSLGLKRIMLNKAGAMDEARDAFYGNAVLGENDKLASLSTIELTRPFAKVRVVATDIEDVRNFGIEPDGATVTYGVALPTEFNAVNGAASAVQTLQAIDYAIDNKAYSDAAGQLTVFADYIFVPENGTISFNLDVKDGGVRIKENNFSTAIPVAVNKVTSIVGDVLTDSKNLDININDQFDADNTYIYLEGDVTLTENLNVNRPLIVDAGKTAVLNLNGYNIINTNPSENFGEGEGIVVYGNLTIEGEGTIQGTSMAVWARGNDNAVVTIKGGTFVGCQEGLAKGGRSVIYASSGNTINIYGGNVQALVADKTSYANKTEGVYAALNIADNNGMINVYGGRFFKQNPAAPGTEPAAWNANHPNGFVVPGYTSRQNGDWFEVGVNTIDDAAGFAAALENANAGDTLLLGKGVVIEGVFDFAKDQITIASIDANNPATIKGRINIRGQYGNNVKFENVAFAVNAESAKVWTSGGSVVKNKPSIFMSESSAQNISFENCTFELSTSAYAFTCEAAGKIRFNECEFNGAFNYAMYVRANIEVTNCTYTTTVTNVLVGACVNALKDGKVVFTNNTCVAAGGNIGLSGAIVFASTNNDNGGTGWVGPVEFTVKDNTGFAYTYERFNDFLVDPNRHTFTEGSERFTF